MQYEKVSVSIEQFKRIKMQTDKPRIYEILYKDVKFNFLINIKPKSSKAIIFGTGAINRRQPRQLPVFDRNAWMNDFNCTTIYYSDPSLELKDDLELAWCYGTNDHWHLESIAYICYIILQKLKIHTSNALFFGSSAGGYTSISLATMLHAKATVINPQLIVVNFWERLVNAMKEVVLKQGENLIEERINIVSLMKKENYFPMVHIIWNIYDKNDLEMQVLPFFRELQKSQIDCTGRFQQSFYYDEKGHNGMPDKETTIRLINDDLKKHMIYKTAEGSFYNKLNKGGFDDRRKKKLYLILSVDTEDKYGAVPNLFECDFGEAGNCGVNYIMEELEKRNMRGVFFTNIYEHSNFTGEWNGYIENLVKRISDRGHEVGLHTHQDGCSLPIYPRQLQDCNYEEQKNIIKYGTDFITKVTGKPPISHRGGGYRCNDITFKVLKDLGYKVDSTYYYSNTGTGNRFKLYNSYNQVTEVNDLTEFPVINAFNDVGKMVKFDPNSMNEKELIDVVEAMKDREDFSAATLMFHSFSFLDQKVREEESPAFIAGTHYAYGVSDYLTKRFETFLDYIYNDPDIEVVTFEEYVENNFEIPSFWGDGPFCTNTLISKEKLKSFKATQYNYRYDLSKEKYDFNDGEFIDFTNIKINTPKLYFNDNDIVEKSDEIINGNLHVYPRCEALKYSIKTLDWDCIHSNISNTFSLYLQGLNPVTMLTRAYEITKDVKYLKKAYEFIDSWYNYSKNEEKIKNSKFAFTDHSVSLRVKSFIYFGKICAENCFWSKEIFSKLRTLLIEHGDWLLNTKNYVKSHNHGIMEDEALLEIGILFNNTEWINVAKCRLIEQEKEAFSAEFVHTENSPEYAAMVSNLLSEIGNLCILNNETEFGNKLINDMLKTKEFIKWVTKPNGIVAQIGDTANIPGKLYSDDPAKIRNGNKENHKIYPKSGYYFYRSIWNNPPKNDTWKMVKSGYIKTVHKHSDDLSFMIYSKGYEIFTDCGIYGYKNDDFRNYFISARAHNTIVVDEKNYTCNKAWSKKTGILKYQFLDKYDHIRLFNDTYDNVRITRDFCSCGDLTVIYDKISSEEIHKYSQIFHVAENINLIEKSKDKIILGIGDTGYKVIIKQFKNSPEISVIEGDISKATYGIISRAENHMDTITTIKYDIQESNAIFMTLIVIVDNEDKVHLEDRIIDFKDIKIEGNNIVITNTDIIIGRENLAELPDEINREYFIEETLDTVVLYPECHVNEREIKCDLVLNKNLTNKYEFAYYLMQGNDVLDVKMYSNENTITFVTPKGGEYRIKYYVKKDDDIKSFLTPYIIIK